MKEKNDSKGKEWKVEIPNPLLEFQLPPFIYGFIIHKYLMFSTSVPFLMNAYVPFAMWK